MKRFLACFLTIAACTASAQESLFSEIGAIEDGLSEITGLKFHHPVPHAEINKDQLRRYLDKRLTETVKPADLRAEDLTLKMLGLIPPDFDLRQNTVDLLTEQAAAFYDYNKKKLFMLEGAGGGNEERVALVHELAHALADQHFRLARFVHDGARSDDSASARLAVMEGQASWLMAAYMSKRAGGPAEVPNSVLDLMTKSVENTNPQYPVFSKAPAYIQESLVFPYTDGMLFQNTVFRALGQQAFSEVFLHPPASTQQIMHPDRYLANRGTKPPAVPDPPRLPNARQFRDLSGTTLGELDYRVLLTQYAGKEAGEDAAAHLLSSSCLLLEHKREKYPVLAFASTWDSPAAASKYVELYHKVLSGKWKTFEIASDSGGSITGRGDTGYFRLWVEGATVNQIEGWKSPLH